MKEEEKKELKPLLLYKFQKIAKMCKIQVHFATPKNIIRNRFENRTRLIIILVILFIFDNEQDGL